MVMCSSKCLGRIIYEYRALARRLVQRSALSAGAAECARTQDLSDGRTRSRLIDTYA